VTTDSPLTPPLLAIISSSNAHENARVRVWTLYYTSCIPCCTYCLSWSQGLFREFLILSRTRINTTYPYPQRRMGRSDMSSSTLEHLAPSFSRQAKLRAFLLCIQPLRFQFHEYSQCTLSHEWFNTLLKLGVHT